MTLATKVKELFNHAQDGYRAGFRDVSEEAIDRHLGRLLEKGKLEAVSYASGGLVGALRLSYYEAREAFDGGYETARMRDEEGDHSESITFNDDCYSSYRSYALGQLAFKVWPKH